MGKGNRARVLRVTGYAAAVLNELEPLCLCITKVGRMLDVGFSEDAVYGMLRKRNR